MSADKLQEYIKLTATIKELEDALIQAKKTRSDVCKALLDENGKDYTYDVSGVLVSVTQKKNVCFMSPKKKGGGRPNPKKTVGAVRVIQIEAKLTSKAQAVIATEEEQGTETPLETPPDAPQSSDVIHSPELIEVDLLEAALAEIT